MSESEHELKEGPSSISHRSLADEAGLKLAMEEIMPRTSFLAHIEPANVDLLINGPLTNWSERYLAFWQQLKELYKKAKEMFSEDGRSFNQNEVDTYQALISEMSPLIARMEEPASPITAGVPQISKEAIDNVLKKFEATTRRLKS